MALRTSVAVIYTVIFHLGLWTVVALTYTQYFHWHLRIRVALGLWLDFVSLSVICSTVDNGGRHVMVIFVYSIIAPCNIQ